MGGPEGPGFIDQGLDMQGGDVLEGAASALPGERGLRGEPPAGQWGPLWGFESSEPSDGAALT